MNNATSLTMSLKFKAPSVRMSYKYPYPMQDPAEAIPKGTLLAIAFTYVTYMYFAMQTGFVFGRKASGVREEFIYWDQKYVEGEYWPKEGISSLHYQSLENCQINKKDIERMSSS